MKALSTTQQEYLKAAEVFLCANAQDFTAWFTGHRKRWKRTEYNLPRMVAKGALTRIRYGRRYVYRLARKRPIHKAHVLHGLISTKALLRFKQSVEAQFLAENFFKGQGFTCIPEWAAVLAKTVIYFEYSTADNFRRTGMMKEKLNEYKDNIPHFEDYFEKRALVLFVFDASTFRVANFAERYGQNPNFYFTDLTSFTGVPYDKQLTTPIYIWGGDRKTYALTNNG